MEKEKNIKKVASPPKAVQTKHTADKPRSAKKSKNKKERSVWKSVLPYITIVLGIIIGISIIIVHTLGIDDGAGIVGYAIQTLLAGLFGVGAAFLPFILFYVGLKWIFFNVKWKFTDPQDKMFLFERRTAVLQTAMAFCLFVILSVTFGVIEDPPYYSAVDLWTDGADLFRGGGFIGGSVAFVMVAAFKYVITYIILALLAVLALLLMAGLTPDRVIFEMKKNREQKRLERARYREEEKRALAEMKRQQKLEAAAQKSVVYGEAAPVEPVADQAQPAIVRSKPNKMSVDELLGVEPAEPAEKTEPQKEIYIGPSRVEPYTAKEPKLMPETETPAQAKVGKDYGIDPAFGETDYKTLDEVLEKAKSGKIDFDAEDVEISRRDIGRSTSEDDCIPYRACHSRQYGRGGRYAANAHVFPPFRCFGKQNSTETDHSQELQENARAYGTLNSLKSYTEITYSRGPTITDMKLTDVAPVSTIATR